MNKNRLPAQRWICSTLACAIALGFTGPVYAQAAATNTAPRVSPKSRAPVLVNFVNADIEAVTRVFAAMVERPIVVDPRVKGTITVYSEQPQSPRDAWQSYQSALRGLGFAVVESGGLLKVVPEADAKLQTSTVSVGDVAVRGDQIITQIFALRYENPNNLVAVLRPLISANNTINANPGNNALVITDYADNLQRIAKIIAALDVPSGTDVEIVPLQHAVAADLAPLVQRLTDGSGGGAAAGVPGVVAGGGSATVVADSRSNSLIIRAGNAARLAALRATIARLDRPTTLTGPGGGMWVVHLKNADMPTPHAWPRWCAQPLAPWAATAAAAVLVGHLLPSARPCRLRPRALAAAWPATLAVAAWQRLHSLPPAVSFRPTRRRIRWSSLRQSRCIARCAR
jgi:general secretion pathway protein D